MKDGLTWSGETGKVPKEMLFMLIYKVIVVVMKGKGTACEKTPRQEGACHGSGRERSLARDRGQWWG